MRRPIARRPEHRLLHADAPISSMMPPMSQPASTHDRPRILYVITDLNRGGVPLHLHRLAVAMRARGFDPIVVSLAPLGPVATMLEADGVAVRSCGGRGGWDARVAPRLARIIRGERPAIVHAMLFHANVAARWAARRAGVGRSRVLCEIQTVEVERRWHLWVDRWTHRGGRLDPVKGLDSLTRAFESVAADTEAHLVLAGDGPLRAELDRRIATLNLGDRVHLIGNRDDVASLLRCADLFVFPSRTEGLPNALLEAMAAGLPIVTTDAPGCRDLVTDERTGLQVPYGDTSSLARAMRRLLDDRALAGRLGAAARAAVESDWAIGPMLDAYEMLYRRVIAERDDAP